MSNSTLTALPSINFIYSPHLTATVVDMYDQMRLVLSHIEAQLSLITGELGEKSLVAMQDRMREALLYGCVCQVREALDLCDLIGGAVARADAH